MSIDLDLVEYVHEAFEAQVRRTPERTAVVAGHRRTSFAELDQLAERIARSLRIAGAGPGELVGVCLGRDEYLIAALLAVLKTGAAYVPLDPAYPAQRLRFIAEDAGLKLVVTSAEWQERANLTGAEPVLVDQQSEWEVGAAAVGAQVGSPRAVGAAAAYVIYTSGSTGVPKGVVVDHHNTMGLIRWALATYSEEEWAGTLMSTSVCFDVSVAEIYPPLVSGGMLIMADNLLALPGLPARDEVRMIGGVPSVLATLARAPLPFGVRTVTAAGEPLSRVLTDRLYANPGVRRVLNCYGPTECTTYCSGYDVARDDISEPSIGYPLAGALLSVRDDSGGVVDDGDVGELWVAGPVVTRGYLGRSELTEQRFVTTPEGERAYRTGDLVRRVGGVYHYVGRQDHQVKVRGFRIELGEVEAALVSHPAVNHAVVVAPADDAGTRWLAGYVEPVSAPPREQELRAYLRERLPDYMVPTRIAVLDRIPIGPTGKVDRAALPPLVAAQAETDYVAPRNDTEARIAAVVADVLGRERVGVHDRFTDLGGHSLAAARVVARVGEEFDRVIPLARFLLEPTVAGLAQTLSASSTQDGVALVRHEGREEFPLLQSQEDFWTMRQIRPGGDSIGVGVRLRLCGVTDLGAVQAALDALVVRHEILRTVIEDRPDGPVAVVRPPAPVPVVEHDLRGMGDAERAARLEQIRNTAVGTPFDVARDVPMLRAAAAWTGDGEVELTLVADHASADGWSIAVFMPGLAGGIEAVRQGRPALDGVAAPPVQIGDVALCERAEVDQMDRAALRAYWRNELAGVQPPNELFAPASATGWTAHAHRITRALPADLDRAVNEFAAACGVSPFATYLAALDLLIASLSGRGDVLVGAVAAQRARSGVDQLVGPLVETLPVRVSLDDDPPFRVAAARAAQATTRALAHRGLPTNEVFRGSGLDRGPGESGVPVALSMQPDSIPTVVVEGDTRVELLGEVGTPGTPNEMTLYLNRTVVGPEIQVDYLTDRLDRAGCESFVDRLLQVLQMALADPDRPISTVDLLTAAERDELLRIGTGPALPEGAAETVVAAVLEQAERRPEAVAAVYAGRELTYAELVERSARVAGALVAHGASDGCVALCLPRDRWMQVAMLGVARAGAAYLPLDPDHPVDRLAHQLHDAGASLVIAAGSALGAARAIPGAVVLDLAELVEHPHPTVPLPKVRPEATAYLLYTSGSTGRPKGVEVTHANLAGFVAAMLVAPGVTAEDRVLALSPTTFDVSGFDLWVSLCVGACTVIADRDTAVDGYALAALIDSAGVTAAMPTPTSLRMLTATGWRPRAGLRLFSIGEAVDPALARDLRAQGATFWNTYGPTETTIVSTVHPVLTVDDATVPIGRPCHGERAYVLDRWGRLVPQGVGGDLWIGGVGVASGYRNRPELTAEVFTDDPYAPGQRRYRTGDRARWNSSGELEFLGRQDHQVKVRGYRIELGEIEAVLRDHDEVAHVAVVVGGTGASAHLVGYVVWRTAGDIDALERYARGRLPEYMVPRRWVEMESLPTLSSGKVNRKALPDPGELQHDATPPRSALEEFVAETWQEVLAITGVGAFDDFFVLGGHSFAATRVVGRLREALGCELPVRALFDRPVLADFAAHLEQVALAELAAEDAAAGAADAGQQGSEV